MRLRACPSEMIAGRQTLMGAQRNAVSHWTLDVSIFCRTVIRTAKKCFVDTIEFGPTATYLPANLKGNLAGDEH